MISSARQLIMDPNLKGSTAQEFESALMERIVGQDEAVRSLAALYQVAQAGLAAPNRPLGSLLFLGPTGTGKTRLVEAAAEAIFGNAEAMVKVDCAEYQHPHEIARLIGSPPGYIGHRETQPLLAQENLDRFHSEGRSISLVLFDEIEKASDVLWKLLLGILDRAALTLGDNQRVTFSRTIIVMTSNLGARAMNELIAGTLGFAPALARQTSAGAVDGRLERIAIDAAQKHFAPEFMNRIDRVAVFRSLQSDQLHQILDLELRALQRRIDGGIGTKFTLEITDAAKKFLLAEGTDDRYGARHLRRSIDRHLVTPLAGLTASGQVQEGDLVTADHDSPSHPLAFFRARPAAASRKSDRRQCAAA